MAEIALTSVEMVEVAQVFQDAYRHVLSNMTAEAQGSINDYVKELVLKEKPWMLVTSEGIGHAMKLVWTREGIRDFILTLSFTFFARWGQSSEKYDGLVEALARGTAMTIKQEGRKHSRDAVPEDVGQRLSDISAARQVIAANKWLMIVLMLPLFLQVAVLSTGIKPEKN